MEKKQFFFFGDYKYMCAIVWSLLKLCEQEAVSNKLTQVMKTTGLKMKKSGG